MAGAQEVALVLVDVLLGRHARGGGQRARLRHAPALDDGNAEALVEGADERLGHGGAAALDLLERRQIGRRIELEHPLPDGGDAGRAGDALGLDQLGELGGSRPRAGEDEPRARQGRRVGEAPGVGVEHRHHRHHGVGGAQADRVRAEHGERVQNGGAMRVHDALRAPRGAGRVAHGRGGALVEVGERKGLIATRQELLVVEGALAASRAVGHQHLMLDPVQPRHRVGQ